MSTARFLHVRSNAGGSEGPSYIEAMRFAAHFFQLSYILRRLTERPQHIFIIRSTRSA